MLLPRSIASGMALRTALRPSRGLVWRGLAAKAVAPPPRFEYDVDRLHDKDYLNLPKLPLPAVSETITRYLETVRPLTTDEEFEVTSAKANAFAASDQAQKIQAELKAMSDAPGYPFSYVEKYWDDM
jgi:carnitine O-acetyltransferase